MPCMRTFFNGTVTVSGMNVLIKNRKKRFNCQLIRTRRNVLRKLLTMTELHLRFTGYADFYSIAGKN